MAVEWLKGMLPPYRQSDTPLVEEIIQMFERKSPDLFEIQMLALLGRPNATPLLAIQCPALVLTGFDDAWSPPARHLKWPNPFRIASWCWFPNAGTCRPWSVRKR